MTTEETTAVRVATPWGQAEVVEQITVRQQAGEQRFATFVQLLELPDGQRLVSMARGGRPTGRVTLRARDVARIQAQLRARTRRSRSSAVDDRRPYAGTADAHARSQGLGLHPLAGVVVYDDGELLRCTTVTPEEEAIRFLLDGLDVGSISELHRLVERGRGPCLVSKEIPWSEDLAFPAAGNPLGAGIRYRIESERDGLVEDVISASSTATIYARGAEPE